MTTDLTGQAPQVNNAPTTTATTPTTEAAAPATDPKLLELAQRTKAARQAQLKLQADRQEFERKQAEFVQRQKEYETNYIPKDRVKTDLIGVLTEAGLNAEQISGLVNNQPVALELEMRSLKQQIAELKAYNEQSTKKLEESSTTQYQQAVNQIRTEASKLVDSDPRFETVKAFGQSEAVVKLVESVFKDGMGEKYPAGTVLSTEDACTLIEEELFPLAEKATGLEKLKKKQQEAASAQVPAAPIKNGHTITKQVPPTLTNSVAATPARNLSAAEKRARAIAIMEGRQP